jgi:hypothetical protein
MKYLIGLLIPLTGCVTAQCPGSIGAVYKYYENTVEYVFEGSPADRIGLKPGDEILYPWDIKGMPGSHRHVRIIRNDQLIVFDEVLLVCVDDFKNNWSKLK